MKTRYIKKCLWAIIWLVVSALNCQTIAQPPANYTEDSAGFANNPYQIGTLANLRWLSETVEVWGGFSLTYQFGDFYIVSGTPKYFIQTADIDASETILWNDGFGFSPIGTAYFEIDEDFVYTHTIFPFQGFYNGDNHKISNLYINRHINEVGQQETQMSVAGLFGLIWHSTIKNVHLEDACITMLEDDSPYDGPMYMHGMLIYSANHSSIHNCSATGTEDNTGVLIGHVNYNSIVEYCSSITRHSIGGSSLIGEIVNGIVRNSFARGRTNFGDSDFQGLIGIAGDANMGIPDISNVYITSLDGETNVNYLVGGPHIFHVSNSFWNSETSSTPNPLQGFPYLHPSSVVMGCVGHSTDIMKTSASYTGWDFENIWGIDPDINEGYPYLRHDIIAQSLSSTDQTAVPIYSSLLGNYPNPFNPSTSILYNIAQTGNVRISVYNIKGQMVRILVNEPKATGQHSIIWDGLDYRANKVSSGIYFYKMDTKSGTVTKKMMLVK